MADHAGNELIMFRVLDAPPANVWRAFREREHLMKWWGMPHGVTMTFCEVDFRVGAHLHCATQWSGREPMWFKCLYRQIVDFEQIVLDQHRSDEKGSVRDSSEWPASTIALHLEDLTSQTRLKVIHTGMVSERASIDDYWQGWTETLDRLAACLACLELRALSVGPKLVR